MILLAYNKISVIPTDIAFDFAGITDIFLNDAKAVADEVKNFGTDTVVITGMYRFNYSSLEEVTKLAKRLMQL